MEGDFTRFPIEKYNVSKFLGQGGFGNVLSYTILQKEDSLPDVVAVKIFQQKHASNLHKEKDIMEALAVNRHPNIVKYFGMCQLPRGQEALVYEVFDIDLMEFMMKKNTSIHNGESRNILHQIAKALQHMRNVKTVHRDVKPENVLLKFAETDRIKVCQLKTTYQYLQ